MNEKWSPEQISGVGKLIGHPVSHEWIYGYVQRDKLTGGKLYKQLRHGLRKCRKGSRANRVGTEHRRAIVDKKKRFGNWEADTIIGKNGTGTIVSLVERKCKFYLIRKVPAKSAAEVSRAMVGMLWRYRRHGHTITADNGTESCGHELVAEKLKTDVYFANPYSSWERGLSENLNGLLRQHISKGTDLSTVKDEQIAQAQRALNLRSRNCLSYKKPEVVFNKLRGVA